MGTRAEIHDRVLSAKSVSELMEVYEGWAANYDHDLIGDWGYLAPQITVALVDKYVKDRQAVVLDAGCGTGLVGQLLAEKGFRSIDGADYSHGMLEQAAGKKVYADLLPVDLNKRLALPDGAYDLVTCVGTFSTAHVAPEALRELVRITRSGGFVCFTVRDSYWEETGFARLVLDLEVTGKVRLKEVRTEFYIEKEGSLCKVVVLEVQ